MTRKRPAKKPPTVQIYNVANGAPRYWVMDGRAHFDIDRANVLDTAQTMEQAVANMLKASEGDACIVDTTNDTVVDSRAWRAQGWQPGQPEPVMAV